MKYVPMGFFEIPKKNWGKKEIWISTPEEQVGVSQLYDNLFGSSQPVFMREDNWP